MKKILFFFLRKMIVVLGIELGGESKALGAANAVLLTIATVPNTYPHY